LIANAGGKLEGGKAVNELAKAKAAYRSILDSSGGLKKFCAAHREIEFITQLGSNGWVQKRAQEASSQDVIDTLLDLIDKAGGKLYGSQVVTDLGRVNDAFGSFVDAAGGPKKFCLEHREVEFITESGGHGFVQRRVDEVSAQDLVDAMLQFLNDLGGKVGGGRAVNELLKINPAFKAYLDECGGLRKFCASHQEINFIAEPGSDGYVVIDRPEMSTRSRSEAQTTSSKLVPVSKIRWCQDCIKARFRNGTYLIDLLQQLLDEPARAHLLPLFDVVELDGLYYAISGNRHLWVLKEFASLKDPSLKIQVRVRNMEHARKWAKLFAMRSTTQNGGMHVDMVLRYHLQAQQRFPSMALALGALLRNQNVQNSSIAEDNGEDDEEEQDETEETLDSEENDGNEESSTGSGYE